jgi:hypothetical protein
VPDLFESFCAVVAALDDAGVPFAVCGGLAMSIHARPRATIDIDLLAPSEAVERLVSAVEALGFARRHRQPIELAAGQVIMHRLTRIVPGDPDVLTLDVIEVRPGAAARAWDTRESADWQGRAITVVSREGLIVLKRLRSSPQDLADIAELEAEA